MDITQLLHISPMRHKVHFEYVYNVANSQQSVHNVTNSELEIFPLDKTNRFCLHCSDSVVNLICTRLMS